MSADSNQIAFDLLRAFRQLRTIRWNGLRAEGCTPGETILLHTLRRHMRKGSPGMKTSEIGRHLRVSTPSVTQMVNVLEARGLVERKADPADRRIVRIALTESGQEEMRKVEQSMLEGVSGLIAYLGLDRSRQLIALLDDVHLYYSEREAGMERFPAE
ncbi:MarR family winged helix-turn-helix transcriptional regulator [Paenibacillus thermoaerophilus]|uniref:MarR family winged helix-turn-helix transcriptional regulator n=1 Tax=Paenibacillus thermoaerophilus TaxID=1215385 RepID=A0ABW2V016_9BACL|nr:MarR family transcriptional regulator [Paenibacillus thermoaerophilus]TMV18242.1 MarR family transcriptional regulator [Paenibacillus thermoaerophilus]